MDMVLRRKLIDEDNTEGMIEHEEFWPLWPKLPLKKYSMGGSDVLYGVLYSPKYLKQIGHEPKLQVQLGENAFSGSLGSAEVVLDYASAADVAAAGWKVD